MKAVCAFCGFRNKIEAPNCAKCGASLTDAPREKFTLPWASWVPAIPFAILCAWQFSSHQKSLAVISRAHAQTIASIQTKHRFALQQVEEIAAHEEAEAKTKHDLLLSDEAVLSGRKAAERHAAEWSRRQSHDPAYISTLLEKTLLDIERLGKDSSLTAETALRKVAEVVSPPGSRIEVTPSGSRHVVRVAFRLSALAPMEAGSVSQRISSAEMRDQAEQATARLIKELFDYCGSRGIERISVSCNRAITETDDTGSRLRMRSLYRASINSSAASQVSNWRSLSLLEVKRLMKVEHDLTSKITFRHGGGPALPFDPNEPLEF